MRIKGFDKDLKCREGFQFEIGKTYDTGAKDEDLRLCSNTVFHYCDSLQKVHSHYNCAIKENRYCEIEVLGKEITDGKKCGSNKIKIVREIKGDELKQLKGLINGNTGIFNTGEYNSGRYNTGDWNTGSWNKCNFSNGFFNTAEDNNIMLFNKRSEMSTRQFIGSKYYNVLTSAPFVLTEWIEYTDEEKKQSKEKELIGGYLRRYSYKEACANWWGKMSDENKEIIKSIPNFDAEIFKEITGIEV